MVAVRTAAALVTRRADGRTKKFRASQRFHSATPGGRTAFANNQIPLGSLNSAARAIVTSPFYPGGAIANNISQFRTNSYQGDLKIDYAPSEKDHLMGRWSQQFVTAPVNNSIQLLGKDIRAGCLGDGDLHARMTPPPLA